MPRFSWVFLQFSHGFPMVFTAVTALPGALQGRRLGRRAAALPPHAAAAPFSALRVRAGVAWGGAALPGTLSGGGMGW